MATPARQLVVCIVTGHKTDVSLVCGISVLRLQTMLMTHKTPVNVEVHFVNTHDDALNALWARPEAEGVLVVEGHVGLAPEFLTSAMASGRSVVVASHPLPVIDWERVKTMPAGEEPSHWGNVYNALPASPDARPDTYGHVEIKTASALGAMWVRRQVLVDIAARHPGIMQADGAGGAFATRGVYDGVRHGEQDRFLQLYGGILWADVVNRASCSGPTEFCGAVAGRSMLR